ncbi:Os03g0231650 [Oryza sativa Japonica Group]|uniref:Os03g0231650 protein n=1 Tax=Oryza sativa subsp. japonica TaxID=39947 RepID=A0A0P0VV13_ORYSJ|nr:hypothetical protein EE612_016295 [Oryza sativa]BAS83104.1 Os03g0231650 [Oryza sativa Japonica Group]
MSSPELILPLPMVSNTRYWGNDHRCSGAEHLVCADQIVDGDEPLIGHLIAAVPGELDDALARDPRQDGSHGGRRGDDAVLDDEEVAGGGLLQVRLVHRVEVQHVSEPSALGVHLRLEHLNTFRFGDRLDPAGAARHGPVYRVLYDKVYRR